MIVVAIMFLLSVLIVPSLGLSKKHKGESSKHRSYSQWERSRASQQRFSH